MSYVSLHEIAVLKNEFIYEDVTKDRFCIQGYECGNKVLASQVISVVSLHNTRHSVFQKYFYKIDGSFLTPKEEGS